MLIDLNLATRRYVNRRAVTLWLLLVGLFLLSLFFINLVYALQNYQQLKQIDENLVELNKQLAEVHGVSVEEFTPEAYAEVMSQVEAVNQVVEADRFRWTELLGRFEKLLPGDVSILGIQPSFKEKNLKITASARTVTDMTLFLDRLMATDDFNDVVLFNHAEVEQKLPNGSTSSVVNFSIEIRGAF